MGYHGEVMGPGQAIEIKARVQPSAASQPAGAQRDFILATGDERGVVQKGRFELVALVFAGAGGDEVKHLIAGIAGLGSGLGEPVGARRAPMREAGIEIAILNELLASGGVGHADVVEQHLARSI